MQCQLLLLGNFINQTGPHAKISNLLKLCSFLTQWKLLVKLKGVAMLVVYTVVLAKSWNRIIGLQKSPSIATCQHFSLHDPFFGSREGRNSPQPRYAQSGYMFAL